MSSTEFTLIERAKNGDGEALNELFQREQQSISKMIKRKTGRLTIGTALILLSNFLFAVEISERRMTAVKISQPMTIDGHLNEPGWKSARPVSNFVQREPKEGEPASEKTEVRVLYDEYNLYLGIFCFDREPHKIVANEMRRDAELQDNDYFEIFIDASHDHRNAFYFAVNPLGGQRDGLIRDEGSNLNWDWDGIWVSRARRNDQGWTAEIAIPFYSLRFNKSHNQTWGINFGRHIARKREEVFWSPILRNFGWFGKFKVSYCGHLTGLENLNPGKRIQLMPYLIGGGVQEEGEGSLGRSGDMGLDLKYRLTSSLTADLTVNTDFAQVEADQEQFNLTRFSLFFPEKRGFFLEGADIFRFGERFREHEPPSTLFFFSRRIGLSDDGAEIPIIGGARVTGKAGSYDLGILNILADRISYEEEGERVDIERMNYSVFRLKRDFLSKSTIGVMLLGKNSLQSSAFNRGVGFDFDLAFGPSVKIGGFAANTFTPELEGKDWAANLDFVLNSDFWAVDCSYTDIGENFNAELGFIPRTDIRKVRTNLGVGPRLNILNLRQTFFFDNLTYVENHSGRVESKNNMFGLFNIFQDGSFLFFGYVQNYEYIGEEFEIKEDVFIPTGEHRFDMLAVMYESDKTRRIALTSEVEYGEFYNGNLFRVNASGILKLSRHFNLEFIYDRNQLDLPVEGGKFTTNIAAARIIYSFTPDLFARAYLQWNDDEGVFIGNFLVRWIYKPGASVYFIYNETRTLGAAGYVKDRVLMLKVSLLFNY